MNLEDLLRRAVFVYLLSWFVGGFYCMALLYSGTLDGGVLGLKMDDTLKSFMAYGCAGAIGGTLYQLRLYHTYYEMFKRRWFVWHVIRPFLCGGTAVMTIILFDSGLMLLQVGETMTAKIGLSFLIGFGYGKFMDKLKALTETLFDVKEVEESKSVKKDE